MAEPRKKTGKVIDEDVVYHSESTVVVVVVFFFFFFLCTGYEFLGIENERKLEGWMHYYVLHTSNKEQILFGEPIC